MSLTVPSVLAEGPAERALESLGLPPYAARVYAALARVAQATAAELSEEARVPRQRVYDVLESLIDQGLVTKGPAKPAVFHAVDPLDASAVLLGAQRENLVRLESIAADLVADLRRAWQCARAAARRAGRRDTKSADTSGDSGRITMARMEHWRDYAMHSVLATARPPFEGLGDPDWIRRVRTLTRSGGTVRCIYHSDLLDDPALVRQAAAYAAAGEEARITDGVETRMILTDSARALLTLPGADRASATGPVLMIDLPPAVEELAESFTRLWDHATPFAA
ncbi:TrmB family transcriptional regulator [Streptacidiphilus fuscans]|uniref:TrmB family transcriptional regulator n=1 Tax=Streptacidiphilus fuscans TaxID=2789292 RepID=A0A931FFD2_9ACTN|nr:TrmB family transcriptional regulator [Streptacidiphilus fuscans]MBF9069696.1 TrmB family transcriptional regulator [Streptacidiphilus fuscans]